MSRSRSRSPDSGPIAGPIAGPIGFDAGPVAGPVDGLVADPVALPGAIGVPITFGRVARVPTPQHFSSIHPMRVPAPALAPIEAPAPAPVLSDITNLMPAPGPSSIPAPAPEPTISAPAAGADTRAGESLEPLFGVESDTDSEERANMAHLVSPARFALELFLSSSFIRVGSVTCS